MKEIVSHPCRDYPRQIVCIWAQVIMISADLEGLKVVFYSKTHLYLWCQFIWNNCLLHQHYFTSHYERPVTQRFLSYFDTQVLRRHRVYAAHATWLVLENNLEICVPFDSICHLCVECVEPWTETDYIFGVEQQGGTNNTLSHLHTKRKLGVLDRAFQ